MAAPLARAVSVRRACCAALALAWTAACGGPEPGDGAPPAPPAEAPAPEDAARQPGDAETPFVSYDADSGRVTLRAGGIRLAELLERIAAATGVEIANAQAADSPQPLEVAYEESPLGTVLDALLDEFDKIVVSAGTWPDGTPRIARVLVVGRRQPAPPTPPAEEGPGIDERVLSAIGAGGSASGLEVTGDLSEALVAAVASGDHELAGAIVEEVLQSELERERQRQDEGLMAWRARLHQERDEADLDAYLQLRDAARQLEADPRAQALSENLFWLDERLAREERQRLRRERQQLREARDAQR